MSIGSDQAVVVWGEVLWDLFPDGPQLGGAPANVAWHLGLAGGWARLVTRVGDDDNGRRALDMLEQAVDTSLIQVDPVRATGVVEVRVEAGEPRYRLVPGRAWERIACTDLVREALDEASVLVYGTLSQHTDEGLASWQQAIDAARCLKVCDVNLRKVERTTAEERRSVAAAIAAADLIKVNDKELVRLAEWFGWRDPIAALRDGRRIVALTRGAAGSSIIGEHGVVEIAPVRAAAGGDNVGCGDAYLALLVHGMTLGWDLAQAGAVASRWAAAVAGVRGATPHFSDEQVDELLGEAAA